MDNNQKQNNNSLLFHITHLAQITIGMRRV